MSRRNTIGKRELMPDSAFGSVIVAKFINVMMYSGKKEVASGIFRNAINALQDKLQKTNFFASAANTGENMLSAEMTGGDLFVAIIRMLHPVLEVRSRRIGGSTYQIPVEVSYERAQALAMSWLLESARKRKGKSMSQKLSDELFDIANGRGESLKTRENTHKMAEANRVFAHFRW